MSGTPELQSGVATVAAADSCWNTRWISTGGMLSIICPAAAAGCCPRCCTYLGIDEITIDDVADVRFSDPSLLMVEQVDGDTGRAIWEALKAGELAADGAEQPAAQAIGDDASPDPEAAISEDVNGAETLSDPTVESAMLRIKAICPGNPASTSSTACRQAGMI